MTSSPHAPEPHRATARLDIWTVNVTEPVFVGCLSSREPVPAICRPAALLGAHLCCHQQPGMSETRSFRWDGEQMSSHAGAETAEAGESREEVIDPLVSGRGGCGVGGVGNYERYDGRWRSPAPALLPKTNQPAASTAPQLPKVAPRVHSSAKTPGLQTILLRKDFFVCINCIIMKYHVQYFSLRICTWSDPYI